MYHIISHHTSRYIITSNLIPYHIKTHHVTPIKWPNESTLFSLESCYYLDISVRWELCDYPKRLRVFWASAKHGHHNILNTMNGEKQKQVSDATTTGNDMNLL